MTEIFKVYENKLNHFTSLTNQKLEISNLGNVKIDGELIDFSKRHPSKYHQVHLLYVHRMVAETFIPNPENKPFVDHIDTNKLNNSADNLRWVTHKENLSNPITKRRIIEERTNRKGTPFSRKKIAKIDSSGNILDVYESASEAALRNNISISNISNAVHYEERIGRYKNKPNSIAGGFYWK